MPVFECCSSLFVSVLSLKIKLSGGEDCDPLTGLTLPHICACPKPGHEFPTSYVVDLFMFSGLRWLCVLLIFLELLIITFLISFRNYENETKIILNRNE